MAFRDKDNYFTVSVDSEDLSFRMNAAMHIAGLTHQDVADYMGTRVDYVKLAMQGRKHYVSVHFLAAFSAVCRVSIADLLPFVNDVLPFPYTYTVPGGGAVSVMSPSPYRVVFSDPEKLGDNRWFTKEQDE